MKKRELTCYEVRNIRRHISTANDRRNTGAKRKGIPAPNKVTLPKLKFLEKPE
jgi:hypothetical protein